MENEELSEDLLEKGWTVHLSRSKRKHYYYNTTTKTTQWKKPKLARSPPKKIPAKEKAHCFIHQSMVVGMSNFVENDYSQSNFNGHSKKKKKAQVFTPWQHQITAVSKLVQAITSDVSSDKPSTYLLQHSTGAGKSITIACLVHQLLYLVDDDKRKFHIIIVLVDRIKLDDQLGQVIEKYLSQNGINEFYRAQSVQNLSDILSGKVDKNKLLSNGFCPKQKVVLTTTQKLNILMEDKVLVARLLFSKNSCSMESSNPLQVNSISNADNQCCRIGIITDEAHRSHNQSTRFSMDQLLHKFGAIKNKITYVGFSATPSSDSLRLFGTTSSSAANKQLIPFDTYSMSEAISQSRIMNVLTNCEFIQLSIETTIPPSVKAKLLECKAFLHAFHHASSLHRIRQFKADKMLDHFSKMKSINKFGKCMIVVRSRLEVVQYYRVIQNTLTNREYNWKIFGAFSADIEGSDSSNTSSITEQKLNASGCFSSSLNNADIIIACDKFDTGFNEPKLIAMYIDRRVKNKTHTVQLLSRLNRPMEGKNHVKIVDFVNNPFEIERDFSEYWGMKEQNNEKSLSDWIAVVDILLFYFWPFLTDSQQLEEATFLEKVCMDLLSMERDCFKQVHSAITEYLEFCKCKGKEFALLPIGFFKVIAHKLSPFLKPIDKCVNDLVQNTISRMDARVSGKKNLFLGPIKPRKKTMIDHGQFLGFLVEFGCFLINADCLLMAVLQEIIPSGCRIELLKRLLRVLLLQCKGANLDEVCVQKLENIKKSFQSKVSDEISKQINALLDKILSIKV